MAADLTETRPLGSLHLDTVRGAAALIVLVGHSSNIFFSSAMGEIDSTGIQRAGASNSPSGGQPAPVHDTPTLAAQAVVIFFVLSGFLVGGSVIRSLQRGSWSWPEFLGRRLTRLWIVLLPALLLGVSLDLVGTHVFPKNESIYWHTTVPCLFPAPVMNRITALGFLGNMTFLQVAVVPSLGSNTALWSLTNEFWYYVLFPLLLIALWRGARLPIRFLYAALAVGILVFLGKDIALRFPLWICGALVAAVPPRLPYRLARFGSILLSLLFLPLLVLVRKSFVSPMEGNWCVALFFAVLIYLWMHLDRPARNGFYRRFSQWLSELSYPVYLLHLPILAFLCAWTNTPFHKWPRTVGNLTLVFAFDLVAIGAAYALHVAFQSRTDEVRIWVFDRFGLNRRTPVRVSKEPVPIDGPARKLRTVERTDLPT